MTDREAFSMAVAKWRTLSDAEKEEWRVKPRKSAGGGGGGFQKVKYMQTRGFGGGEGDAEMLSISSVRILGRMFGHFFLGIARELQWQKDLLTRTLTGRGTNGS
jgi:hypothetical protein